MASNLFNNCGPMYQEIEYDSSHGGRPYDPMSVARVTEEDRGRFQVPISFLTIITYRAQQIVLVYLTVIIIAHQMNIAIEVIPMHKII